MLTPEQAEGAGELVAEVYRQIEAELLEYLVAKMIEGDVSGQRAATALNLLAQSMPTELKKIIDAHADEIDDTVRQEVESALSASDAFDLARITAAAGVTLADSALTAQTAAVATGARDVLARDNLDLSAAARSKFLQWSTWAATQAATGNMTADKALHRAVRELAKGGLGIEFVTYRDEGTGKVTVTNRVDVAVQRHLRTLIAQGAAELTMARIQDARVEFVEVSSHYGSRPSHAEWQGRCYHVGGAVEVDGVRYEDFEFGTGYKGTCGPYTALGDQLLGVNCRHSFAPWQPGMPRAYSPDPEHPSGIPSDEAYALAQRQRARERRIRETKRELATAEQLWAADPTAEHRAEVDKLKLKLRRQQEGMRKFIKEANAKCKPGTEVLHRQPRREWAGDRPKSAIMENMRHKEPLVKMAKDRNALSVSPAVNAKGFHDAFSAMPVPKPVAESAYREAGRILSACDGTEFEHLVAIDARTGVLVADNLDVAPTRARATGFRNSDIAKIRQCSGGVVTIHNHPGSKQPSFRDVVTAAENAEVRASIVVGHDGSVWYVSVNDPSVADQLLAAYNESKAYLGEFAEQAALKTMLEDDKSNLIDWRRLR